MRRSLCEELDDYLGQNLSEMGREAFDVHLADCSECRAAVAEFRRWGHLLGEAVVRCELVPFGLTARVRQRNRYTAQTRLLLAASTLIAASLLIGFGLDQRAMPPRPLPVAPGEEIVAKAIDPRSLVKVDFGSESSHIATPVPTQSRNVTIIWLYATETTRVSDALEKEEP